VQLSISNPEKNPEKFFLKDFIKGHWGNENPLGAIKIDNLTYQYNPLSKNQLKKVVDFFQDVIICFSAEEKNLHKKEVLR
jgi:hypothetical protein